MTCLLFRNALAAISVLFLPLGATAMADTNAEEPAQGSDIWQSWPLGDRFRIGVNAFFPRIDTRVRVDSTSGVIGTTIDLEQNLGMSDAESLPAASFVWRFAKKHRLKLDVFELNRSGSAITSTEIRFGDQVFQIDLPISSFFDTRVTSLGYSYSLIFDEKKELAISVGLSVMDIKLGVIGTVGPGIIETDSGITAPLPMFGLTGAYAINESWVARAGLGIFSIKLALSDEERLSGEIFATEASIEHRTFDNVHFGLAYTYFDVRAEFEDARRLNLVRYRYRGPMLRVVAVF